MTLHSAIVRRCVRTIDHTLRGYGPQAARFAVVGAAGFVVNLALYSALVSGAHVSSHYAAVAAFALAVTHNYLLNRAWTFRTQRGGLLQQGLRFLLVSVGALLVNFGALTALLHSHVAAVPAEALAIGAAMPASFVANRLWAFRAWDGHRA